MSNDEPRNHMKGILTLAQSKRRKKKPALNANATQELGSESKTSEKSNSSAKPFVERTVLDIIEDSTLSLSKAPEEEKEAMFLHKLSLCCVAFDFMAPLSDEELRAVDKKRIILNDLIEYISNQDWYSEEALVHLIHMIKCNLFRGLPYNPASDKKMGEGEEESFEDPAWPHLHLIYEVLLRFLLSTKPDRRVMQKQITGVFLNTLIQMFESEDAREREYLKTILHRVYGRFMPLRAPIRKSICNVCYRYIYDEKTTNGIAEFLDVFSSIIPGLSLPVKDEHLDFLKNVLMPLHKTRKLEQYHQFLNECVILFICKDFRIGAMVLSGLLKFWPVMNPQKELLFLEEIEEAVGEMMNAGDFEMKYLAPLIPLTFIQISKCIESMNYTVGERGLTMWNSDFIRWLCAEQREIIFPILAPALLRNVESHWSANVRTLSKEVRDVVAEMDPLLWQKSEDNYKEQRELFNTKVEKRRKNHDYVRRLAEDAMSKLTSDELGKLKLYASKLHYMPQIKLTQGYWDEQKNGVGYDTEFKTAAQSST